ncbi:2'-5' RNA ligase family protein [Silvimonas soli]|uniref:2'-5' RNA ligase family protein n=1 Tax=Silvimonas soli TaxID=2980100 RepID=UPI0024B3A971|nr:2'-5' RNA ligase family protein [Silvimonas soli]
MAGDFKNRVSSLDWQVAALNQQMTLPGIEQPELRDLLGAFKAKTQARKKTGSDSSAREYLFIAIRPPASIFPVIEHHARCIQSSQGVAGYILPRWRFHVTVFELGYYDTIPPQLIEEIGRAMMHVQVREFPVMFDRVMRFDGGISAPSRRAVVLCSDMVQQGLSLLGDRMVGALSVTELEVGQKNLVRNPHMTLFYTEQLMCEQAVQPVEWTVRNFALIQSHRGQHKPYTVLGEWTLLGE